MADVHLVRDVLDKQLLDRHHCKMGRVDGVVLSVSGTSQPRVVRLDVGGTTVWRRLHPRLERFARAIRARIGPEDVEPYSIPWNRVITLGKNVTIDIDARRTRVLAWERWLAEHVIGKIPGGSSEKTDQKKQGE